MKLLKKLFKDNSPYLIFLTLAEVLLSIICTMAFVYSDTLSYADSQIFNALGIEKLLESIYSSTWWALILLILTFIAILSITTIYLRKMDYLFIGTLLWGEMLILAINLNNSLLDNLSIMALFVPIIIINIIAFKEQKKKLEKPQKGPKNKASK
ncbi:MAG: hypothetical protein OSJ70_01640 [Bacilli bacterium]|nr:hypothetical protein [Bacilli bacterium]